MLPTDHRLADRDAIDLGELAAERWVAGCPRCRAHLIATCAAHGFVPDILHSADDYVVTQTLVATGLGVALLPSLALAAARGRGLAVAQEQFEVVELGVKGRVGLDVLVSDEVDQAADAEAVLDHASRFGESSFGLGCFQSTHRMVRDTMSLTGRSRVDETRGGRVAR